MASALSVARKAIRYLLDYRHFVCQGCHTFRESDSLLATAPSEEHLDDTPQCTLQQPLPSRHLDSLRRANTSNIVVRPLPISNRASERTLGSRGIEVVSRRRVPRAILLIGCRLLALLSTFYTRSKVLLDMLSYGMLYEISSAVTVIQPVEFLGHPELSGHSIIPRT